MLNIRVQRIRDRRRFEIALFLAEDHEKFKKGSGVMGGLIFSLSEAYAQLGTMELHFVGPPHGDEPEIPRSIRRLAANLGFKFSQKNRITDREGRRLYLRITGFPPDLVSLIEQTQLDQVRLAFIVNRGIWDAEQMEFLLHTFPNPEMILDTALKGKEDRLTNELHQLILRQAIMLERAKKYIELKFLTRLDQLSEAAPIESKLSQIPSSRYYYQAIKVYSEVHISTRSKKVNVPTNETISVVSFPRDKQGYAKHIPSDLKSLEPLPKPVFIAATKDFEYVAPDFEELLSQYASGHQIYVIVIVDYLKDLDDEIRHRIERMLSTKHPMPERPE